MFVNIVVIFFILALGRYFSVHTPYVDSNKNRILYIKIISVILILQSGLRNVAVGADTYAYFLKFEDIKTTTWNEILMTLSDYYKMGIGKDPGFSVFVKITQYISEDYQVFLVIVAILFFYALGNFLYRNTTRLNDIILAFVIYSVLFYNFYSITGIRQTIAAAVTLYGYELIKRKKIIPFIILILLASTIHKSVLIFLPFYFIAHIKNSKLLYRTILFLFPIFMIYRNILSDYVKTVGGYEEYDQFEGAGTFTFTAFFIFIAIVALYRSKSIIQNTKNAKHYFNAFALAILFLPLTWINPSAMRVVQYFSIFMLLLIPQIIYSYRAISLKLERDLRILSVCVLILLLIKSNWNSANEYGFYWEEMRLPDNYLRID